MRIVGPIQFWRGGVISPFFFLSRGWRKKTGGGWHFFFFLGGGEGSTNEGRGSDHAIWGPMRGLKNCYMKRGHIYRQIYRLTSRLLERISLRAVSLKSFGGPDTELVELPAILRENPSQQLLHQLARLGLHYYRLLVWGGQTGQTCQDSL